MKYWIAVAGLFATTLPFAPAYADQVSTPSSFTLRAGVFIPAQGNPSAPLIVGFDIPLDPRTPRPSALSFYADAIGLGSTPNNSAVGAGLSVRSAGRIYAGGGLGLYYTTTTPNAVPAGRFSSGFSGGSATGVGGKLFAGAEITRSLLVEVDYHITPPANAQTVTGAAFELGYRF